ncbi:MAG: hypothetical protein H0U53_01965 [Actinobacteria bacterium]|nr:hypothetical protein [Actinomycetota bacterium]
MTSSNDSVVSHLRAVKEASEKAGPDFPVLSGVNLPNSERFYLYDEKEIAFEKAVLSALQRVTPSRAVIRRAEREFHQDPGFDFVVDDGQHRFLVEARASSRPISRAHLRFFMTNFRHRPPVLVVANSELVSQTADWLQQQPDLFFVTWRSPEDDQGLKASVASLLSGAPSFGLP